MRHLVLIAALAGCATGPSAKKDGAAEPEKLIAEGHAMTGSMGGVRPFAGTPVQVEVSFKDGSPPCMMQGQVQFARDSFHRWVWLEPTEGCPQWMVGRWWAELIASNGWTVSNISSKPVDEGMR